MFTALDIAAVSLPFITEVFSVDAGWRRVPFVIISSSIGLEILIRPVTKLCRKLIATDSRYRHTQHNRNDIAGLAIGGAALAGLGACCMLRGDFIVIGAGLGFMGSVLAGYACRGIGVEREKLCDLARQSPALSFDKGP
jgi:hypothetical protein